MKSSPKHAVHLDKKATSSFSKKQWNAPTIQKLGIRVTSGGGGPKWETHPHRGPS